MVTQEAEATGQWSSEAGGCGNCLNMGIMVLLSWSVSTVQNLLYMQRDRNSCAAAFLLGFQLNMCKFKLHTEVSGVVIYCYTKVLSVITKVCNVA